MYRKKTVECSDMCTVFIPILCWVGIHLTLSAITALINVTECECVPLYCSNQRYWKLKNYDEHFGSHAEIGKRSPNFGRFITFTFLSELRWIKPIKATFSSYHFHNTIVMKIRYTFRMYRRSLVTEQLFCDELIEWLTMKQWEIQTKSPFEIEK